MTCYNTKFINRCNCYIWTGPIYSLIISIWRFHCCWKLKHITHFLCEFWFWNLNTCCSLLNHNLNPVTYISKMCIIGGYSYVTCSSTNSNYFLWCCIVICYIFVSWRPCYCLLCSVIRIKCITYIFPFSTVTCDTMSAKFNALWSSYYIYKYLCSLSIICCSINPCRAKFLCINFSITIHW